jgi:hypothetical protein
LKWKRTRGLGRGPFTGLEGAADVDDVEATVVRAAEAGVDTLAAAEVETDEVVREGAEVSDALVAAASTDAAATAAAAAVTAAVAAEVAAAVVAERAAVVVAVVVVDEDTGERATDGSGRADGDEVSMWSPSVTETREPAAGRPIGAAALSLSGRSSGTKLSARERTRAAALSLGATPRTTRRRVAGTRFPPSLLLVLLPPLLLLLLLPLPPPPCVWRGTLPLLLRSGLVEGVVLWPVLWRALWCVRWPLPSLVCTSD